MKYFLPVLLILTGCNSADTKTGTQIGGYQFPKSHNPSIDSVYCYPILKYISRRDSFYEPFNLAHFFYAFQEPNLSTTPSSKPIFRLIYQSWYSYVITLFEDEITIKKGSSEDGFAYPEFNTYALTPIERRHFAILRRSFPLDEEKPWDTMPPIIPPPDVAEEYLKREKEVDSIIENTPELFNPSYYAHLQQKALLDCAGSPGFTTQKKKISKEKSDSIRNLINTSGYWQLPFYSGYCVTATDGYTFYLEANSGGKYNLVKMDGPCDGNDNKKFIDACYELIKATGMIIW